MIKKFTLLLLAMLCIANGAFSESPIKIIYLNNTQPFTSDSWKTFYLNDLVAGDVLRVCGNGANTIRLAYNTTSSGGWTEKTGLPSLESDGVNIVLTNEEVNFIKSYGLFVSISEGANVTSIGYGQVNCTESEDLLSDDITNDGYELNQSEITNCKIGDEIIFSFEAYDTSKSEFKFSVCDKDNSWKEISGGEWTSYSDMSSQQQKTLKVTSYNVNQLKTGHCCIRCENTKYTSIVVRSYDYSYTYILSSSENNVDIATLASLDQPVNVEFTRASYDNYYNTLCLPFAWTVSETFPGADVYTYSSFDSGNSEVEFTCVGQGGKIDAGVPCFINFGGSAPASNTITKNNVTIVSSPNTSSDYKGNFETGAKLSGTYYGLAYKSSEGAKFYKAGLGATLKGFSAYFVSPKPEARSFSFNLSGTTSITNAVNKVEEGDGTIYNLNGVRLSAPKGIYIKNGKKYISK